MKTLSEFQQFLRFLREDGPWCITAMKEQKVAYAGAGSGGGRNSAISRRISANSILGTWASDK